MDILWNLARHGNVHGALMHGRPAAGPAHRHLLHPGRHRLLVCGALLRRAGLDDPHRRFGLHLQLRHAGRNLRLDHRLGSHPRIRRQQRGRLRQLFRIPQGAAGAVRPRPARTLELARLCGGQVDRLLLQRSRVSHRDDFELAAGARRARVGAGQQHHGGHQDRGHRAVSRGRRQPGAQIQLGAVCALGIQRHPHRRRHRLLHLHRLRLGLHRRRRVAQSAKGHSLRHPRLARRLHRAVCGRGAGAAGHDEVLGLRLRHGRRGAGGLRACSSSTRGPSGARPSSSER